MATMHMQMTVEFARQQIKRDLAQGLHPRWFTREDGTAPTIEEADAYLDDLERDGHTTRCVLRLAIARARGINQNTDVKG
jgi:hypothetical protein